jgi:PST family polysaccharide transporter
MNVDLMLIGRALGATPLGYYQNARSLTDEVRGRIAMPLQRVLFPAFSALQTDNERLQASVIRAGRLLAAVIFPIGIGLSAVAQELVPVLYGDQWLAMIPVLSMLGVSAAIRGSTAIASPLFNAKNRVALALRYNIIGTVLMVIAVVFALPYGVQAVAVAVALVSFYSLVTFHVGLGLIGLDTRHVLQILGFPAIASIVMTLAIIGLRLYSTAWTSHPAMLLPIHVIAGAIVYAVALHLLSRKYLGDFIELARKFKR